MTLPANGGLEAVPKYTSYEAAPELGDQERVGLVLTPVAPFAGEGLVGAAGAVVPPVVPPLEPLPELVGAPPEREWSCCPSCMRTEARAFGSLVQFDQLEAMVLTRFIAQVPWPRFFSICTYS